MDLEQEVQEMKTQLAVIRTNTENHYAEVRADVQELKEGVREVRDKVERLFSTVMARLQPSRMNGAGGWKQTTFLLGGWLFALLMLILQYLLGARP